MHKTRVNALVRERTKDLKKDTEHLKNELQGLKVMFETSRENRGKTLSSGIWRSGKSGPIVNYAKNIYGKEDTKFDLMNFENVKFLKYENSQSLDAKIPTIPKEQRALKEFIKQSKNPKKKPSIKGTRCGQCEEKVANVGCVECGEEYCASCFVVFHLKGNLKKHRSRPIGVENLRTPRLDVMERNITNLHDDKFFKEMGPGTEQLPSVPHLRVRTRSGCNEVSTNDGSNTMLKDGNFNEEDSSLSFQRALNSWRASNHGSGDSKDVLMPNRSVRAVPSQEIAVGTASPSVVSNLDDMMQDLEKKIQETSSLAYSDKLMLKKLRRREFSTSFTDVPKSDVSIASILSDVHEANKEDLFGKNNVILRDAMYSSSNNLTDILESFVNKKESNDDDDDGDDDDDASSNKRKLYTEDDNKSDNHDDFDDGDRMRRSSHVTIEDMHPSVPTPRNFSTKIRQNVKKCDQSDKLLDAQGKNDAKNMNENKNINNKMKKNKVEMNQKTRKIPEEVDVEAPEFNLNMTEDYSSDKTPRSSSRTSVRSTKNLNSSNKTSSRTTSRLMSARLAGERGGFNRKLSEAVSNIANMEVDDAILVDTSLDDFYMAGLPLIEGCHRDEDRQQTDTNLRVSARICVDGNSKEGSKISNRFYQIKRKMWKPKSDYSQGDDDDDEMMRNVKEAMKQIDDNRNDYDNVDDDNDDDIRLEVKLSNNIENNNLSSLAISENLSDDKKLDKCDLPITDNKSDFDLPEHEQTPSVFISEEEMITKFYNSVRQEANAKEVTNPKQGFDKESFGFTKDGLCLNPNSRQVTTFSSKNNSFDTNISSSSSSSFLRKFSPKYLKTSNSPSPNSRQSRVVPPLCVTGRSMTPVTPPLGKCSSNEMFHGDCSEDKFDKNYTEHDKIMKVHGVDCASSSSLTLGYDDDDNDNGDEEEDEDGFSGTSSMISNNKGSLCDMRGSVVQSHLDSRRLSRDIIDDGCQSMRHLQRIDNFNDFNVSFADQESEDIKAVMSLR